MAVPMPESFTGFLDLPREIRDLVYEHILVRNVIPIQCAITKYSLGDPGSFRLMEETYPLRVPRIHRRLWPVPMFDMNLEYNNTNHPGTPDTVYMTYQAAEYDFTGSVDRSNLNFLRASKQIHAEALKIFYSNNIFSFTGDYCIPTAFAFLCDRPAASLYLIKHLELAFMEDSNMRGTTQAHYPIIRRSTDSLVLQYAYHYFTELCTLLSTPRIQLHKLYLSIETRSVRGSNNTANLQDSITWEKQHLNIPDLPPWLEPLLNVGELHSIEICWIARQARVLRIVRTAEVMQRYMLAPAPERVLDRPKQYISSMIKLHVLQMAESDPFIGSRGSKAWEEVVLNGDELEHVIRDDTQTNGSFQASEMMRRIQSMADIATHAYIFSCTLSSI